MNLYKSGDQVRALRYINGGLDGHKWEHATIAEDRRKDHKLIRVRFDDGKCDFVKPSEVAISIHFSSR